MVSEKNIKDKPLKIEDRRFSNFVVKTDDRSYWDEWNFYRHIDITVDTAKEIAKKIETGHSTEPYVLCALSKSGLPLGTLLSLLLNKPLYFFALGEFFTDQGIPIVDIISDSDCWSYNWYLVDSHIHTGQTALLAASAIEAQFSSKVHTCYVIANCLTEKYKSSCTFKIVSLYNSAESFEFLKRLVDHPEILNDPKFWTYHEKSWLTTLSNDISNPNKNFITVNPIEVNTGINDLILKDDKLYPGKLLLHPEQLSEYASTISKKLKDKDIDAIIAATVGGIPLAIALCYFIMQMQEKIVSFIFLGNNSVEYYRNLVCKSPNVVVVDDVISAGSIVAVINETILKPNKINLLGIVSLAISSFPEKGCYIRIDDKGVPLYTAVK
ncbi:MAG: hypothetical protein HQL05_06610 [Nitrospirae bacterium]|uniref:hypothetical protein n=1 Tax=Candidatus Magnetobacterium casense TaxID=1455061 RepID=UPI0012DD7381|nr:hypothetical protein [Candidatus Magnetobacterium casensis]MBF0337489.1 hypothetical protein [Nitrospirota bacterium]